MPRKHCNAREREEKQWSTEFIKSFMKKLNEGKIERVYDTPDIVKNVKRKK